MINNYTAMGRLTADPELKTTKTGKTVTSFILAIPRSFAKSGTERPTDFIRCVAWGKQAEFLCNYFNKGSMVGIVAEIHTRDYTDKAGIKRLAVEAIVKEISFCGSKPQSAQEEATPAQQPSTSTAYPDDYDDMLDEDLPF